MTISKTNLNVTHATVGSDVFSNFKAPLLHTIHNIHTQLTISMIWKHVHENVKTFSLHTQKVCNNTRSRT